MDAYQSFPNNVYIHLMLLANLISTWRMIKQQVTK